MKKTRRLVLIVTLALLAVALALPAGIVVAEAEPEALSDVQLWVLPEYDDPRLLVMIQGSVVGATPPTTIRFLVPDSAEMYSAGSKDAQDNYTGGPPRREASEIPGWDEISYELTTGIFRVEYYAPLILGNPDKTISYDFHTRYDISNLNVIVQEPRTSKDYVVSPASASKTTAFGMDAHAYFYSDLKAGDVQHFDISYTKSDPDPSVSNAPTSGNPSGGTPSGGSPTGGGGAGAITGGITGGLMVVALIAYMLFGRGGKRKPARTRSSRTPRTRPAGKYCRQCGRQIEKSARYCQYCGSGQ